MDSRGGDRDDPGSNPSQTEQPDSVTRGFLFSDLRAYTNFVEDHGAAVAAALLDRYRTLVREAVQHFGGAEIKTEGDSFYVVFNSVSGAVRCGLAITRNAMADARDHSDRPIRVGVGVRAGETIETAEGYVGSPVNIAARICSQAGPNEVLVSETVRSLTRTVLPVRFEARGRRQLKGIVEPVAIYAVVETGADATPWASSEKRPVRPSRRFLLVGGSVVTAVAVAVVAFVVLRSAPGAAPAAAGLPSGRWTIGVDLPLTGDVAFRGIPMENAVRLAVKDANAAGGIDGSHLGLALFDDAAGGPLGQDPKKGAANARDMVADPKTIAMIGPSGSLVAKSVIPVTNAAGLLECSPANPSPSLTKPRYGALDLRKAHPTIINFVRIAPSDDIQAPALASFAYHDLNATVALVVDDTADGREIADGFQQAYTSPSLGGQVIRLALNPGADPMTVLAPLSQGTKRPGVVFFGGFTDTGAVGLRKAMIASGHGDIPFLSWDGLFDGSGADEGSYIQRVTAAGWAGSYVSHATQPPTNNSFVEAYRQAYHAEPDEYAAAAYACVQVIVDSLRAVAANRPSAQSLREALRAYVVDSNHQYDTVVGNVAFDANGDSIRQYVTFYRVDPSTADGKGDWVLDKEHDYGPPP
jgi:ABC-type branched-subunit amino acid transport system substrate-binding protein/class 3 adenylate cyclase